MQSPARALPSRVLLACFGVSLLFLFACGPNEVREETVEIEKVIDANAEPGLIHTVYFWLDSTLTDAERREFDDEVRKLEAIPSVRRMFVGPPAGTPDRDVVNNSFDVALIVWFDDVAGHEEYQVHPIHEAFVESEGAKFAEVRVHDNVLGR